MFRLVRELADDGLDVAVACRLLGVSRSGFYKWKDRPPSARDQENELLLKSIETIHRQSRQTYGSPRVHAELTMGLAMPVNVKRVARLMRQAGIQGLYRRRRRGLTVRDPNAQPSRDLVNRQFTVDEPDRLWVTDITEHPTAEGRLYCAAPSPAIMDDGITHCTGHAQPPPSGGDPQVRMHDPGPGNRTR